MSPLDAPSQITIAIQKAENANLIAPHTGCRVVEGTVGSTGISLAVVARAKGYLTSIVMPDDVAQEKVQALQCLGADVQRVRPASIVDKRQFVVSKGSIRDIQLLILPESCKRVHIRAKRQWKQQRTGILCRSIRELGQF